MSDQLLTTIQAAIETRLRSRISYLKAVGPLGDILAKNLPEEFEIFCPAVYVTFFDADFDPIGMSTFVTDQELRWHFFLIGKNYVTTTKLLVGTDAKKGIYSVIEDVYTCMNGTDLGLSIVPFLPGNLYQEHLDKSVAVYSWLWKMKRRK